MAEPKKETVRIALPPRPEQAGPAPSIAKGETTRIVLPTRTPVTPIRRPPTITPLPAAETTATPDAPTILRRPPTIQPAPTSPLLQPLPKPPGDGDENAPTPPTEIPSVHRGPKKETARISILPKPAATTAPAINMTKTQPLLVRPPATGVQAAPVIITSKPLAPLDAIPRPLCWTVLGISALIFLIQIWNYVVS
ncbi:MAG TPA: hypothetical protein VLH83_06395 [Chthoniobacterales bacterium]|nr:hypothetical protein [Chthoniobacterales bacterium]